MTTDQQKPSEVRRFVERVLCAFGLHAWVRLDDHPMHHQCSRCGDECMDWVW